MSIPNNSPWDDFRAGYNVLPTDPVLEDFAFPRFLQSDADIPFIEYGESEAIEKLTADVTFDYMREKDIPEVDEFLNSVFDRFAVGDFRGDRTVQIAQSTLLLIRRSYFELLRTTVLNEYPLWRICLLFTADVNATIVPHGVYVRPLPKNFAGDDIVAAWRAEAEQFLEREHADDRRQIRYIADAVKKLFAHGEPMEAVKLIAVFDAWRDERTMRSVWVLAKGKSPYSVLYEYASDWGHALEFRVRSDGSLARHGPFDESTGRWLLQFVMSTDTREIIAKNRSDGRYLARLVIPETAQYIST